MELYFSDKNVQTCTRVGLCQMKNGLPSRLALSMKSFDALTNTSSKVVMSYFGLRNGRSCILCTFDIFGNGGSGPSSMILCLPTLPHRGITVLIIRFGGKAVDEVARPVLVEVLFVHGERMPVRVRHSVQVVQVSKVLVEAVYGWQKLVQVTEVVLAKLARDIALRFQGGGERHSLCRDTDVGTGLTDGRQPGADGQLTGDEVCPARRATCFG